MTRRFKTMGALASLALCIGLAGCAVVGGTSGPSPDSTETATAPQPQSELVRRVYGGSVTFDGNRIALTMELVDASGDVSAQLTIPSLSLDAGGGGEIYGDQVTLDLTYGGSCPGRVRLDGTFREVGRRIEGRLTATDCTGEESGAVVLLIRPAGR